MIADFPYVLFENYLIFAVKQNPIRDIESQKNTRLDFKWMHISKTVENTSDFVRNDRPTWSKQSVDVSSRKYGTIDW